MPRPTTAARLWLLQLGLVCLLASPGLGLGAGARSIELTATSNGLEQRQTEHPHLAPDKPSRFDLDVSQYTDTDDRQLLESERPQLATDSGVVESSTVATTAAEENGGEQPRTSKCEDKPMSVKCVEKRLENFFRAVSTMDTMNITDSVQIVKRTSTGGELGRASQLNGTSLVDQIQRFARDHVVRIKLSKDLVTPRGARLFFGANDQGKSTFLTGFGLGFLAFGLKKLFLPLFLGVQIIKSILIALFLPSIIGSIGKIVGKGVTSFAHSSQNPPAQMEENYEFKDNAELYNDDYMTRQPLGTLPASAMYDESMLQPSQTKAPEIASRYGYVDSRVSPINALADRYYTRHMVNPQAKRQDFKVFHEIPTSSLLLTNYDPFYSPLLSRLDAVFSRLGHHTEGCREYAVCAMYRSPARYAPYSNLVSAQLSRELNELRKPSSDNPDVLRFFRYMKAAKDGQDGVRCEAAYGECASARDDQTIRQNQAMLATYQDIDKLVHARKL